MAALGSLLVKSLVISFTIILCSGSQTGLGKHKTSLSVENAEDVLISGNGVFSAGFYPIGQNAYCFAIWFNKPAASCLNNCVVVWMANRDLPVNGRRSKLSLQKTGNLVLTDADHSIVWATNTTSRSSAQLQLQDSGNLVLHDIEGVKLWQSFDSPTDTLLPQQPITKDLRLVSSRSKMDVSSGYYKLLFHEDNVLFLVFDGRETSSRYWPVPWLLFDQIGRSTYNDSKTAVFDDRGHFLSSDGVEFRSLDFGTGIYRRLTLDFDGNLRLYSLEKKANGSWAVTWQASSVPCRIHGACGPNSICVYDSGFGPRCNCPLRFKMKNRTDWSYGCEPEFKIPRNKDEIGFVELHHVDFYGYNIHLLPNYTFKMCKETCLNMSNCKGFQHKFMEDDNWYSCYPKRKLRNGHRSANFNGSLYLKFPKSEIPSFNESLREFKLDCSKQSEKHLPKTYHKNGGNGSLMILVLCASVIGWIEVTLIIFGLLIMYRTRQSSEAANQGYLAVATGFRRFTYAELKKATCDFTNEIGRGGASVVYKGTLPDHQIAAIKRLNEAIQGKEEFLAEVSTIGRLNHMNLIDMWGYCADGHNRLLVYEYMENGSLADNLLSKSLDFEKKFNVAVGVARGLAYLHEECLEWVLHCDVKPQNILLNSYLEPKVADFGLSKILNRGGVKDVISFSRIRGTRGYMAPEWVLNLPITSKVDVYSYGMMVLEMMTGKSPGIEKEVGEEEQPQKLVAWVREKKYGSATRASWILEIVDPHMDSEYDMDKITNLIEVALLCLEEVADVRPSMRQVVEMLLRHE